MPNGAASPRSRITEGDAEPCRTGAIIAGTIAAIALIGRQRQAERQPLLAASPTCRPISPARSPLAVSNRLAPTSRPRYARAMCGRARLSSDVSEIKLVFSIPPHRPTPNIAPSWNVAPTDPLPVVRY
jgi:hypothetical protein